MTRTVAVYFKVNEFNEIEEVHCVELGLVAKWSEDDDKRSMFFYAGDRLQEALREWARDRVSEQMGDA